MHVCVKGNILRFSIYEFALITGLKCFGNVENFKYDDSSPSRLMRMYFSQSTNEVDKEALVERFLKDAKQKIKEVDDSTCINRNELLVKANLDSLESEIKTYVKTYIDMKFNDLENVINDRFCEVLKSLPSKNETVEKKNISKQSRQDGDSSDVVVDVAGPTSADSLEEETDKSVEMKKDKVNQAPSPLKNSEQDEKEINIHYQKVPTDWAALQSYKEKTERDPFQVEYVSGIAQQESESLDCGVFVAIYVEYLSKGLAISSSGIDAQYHRLRYTSFLCKYGFEKAENGYFSENDNPPRSWSKFSPEEIDHVLHIQ
ncbi:hypothetical protein T459_33785 [Capsicum annuum]|uniref:DUF1985 domain-containing protein n=1 Tax=Capsicum annuum TaxID=4072 RepID=A0A2G2XY37_CAPAN|nr:hypothetical protein T459_33785 [Capsicum annuum]